MATSTITTVLQWILLYSSIHLLSLKPGNCLRSNPQKCGNLTIPYPFRYNTTDYGLPGFEITCKGKSSSDSGIPYLPIPSGEVQVVNISYDHILVDATASYALPYKINVTSTIAFKLSDEGPFRISELNNFFAVGCITQGEYRLSFATAPNYFLGRCRSRCNQTRSVKPWVCKENSCCKVPLPGGYTQIEVNATYYASDEIGNSSYSASAIVSQDSFGSNPESKFQLQGSRYSMRLDWAIPNNTYSSSKANISYQCVPNAITQDKGWGYLCKCNSNDTGDGYVNGTGCRAPETKKCTSFSCFQTLSVITGACGTLIAVLLGGGSLFWIFKLRKSKRDKEKNFQRNGGDHLNNLISSLGGVESVKLFSLKEIDKATNKFSQNLILGCGGYGTVYKGNLTNGRAVAVKKSKEVDSKEIDQFINEISILSQINHRNVVKVLGCCLETPVPLLVYEYISNGTLFDHLHGDRQHQQQIPWEKRLCIAKETAEALSYLHSAVSIPIVHRDVKSSNILLDNDYNPKVADFGVSRLVPMGQTHITTVVQGTMGYLDPEYFQTVQLTEKSDVYSFGVVLVELLTGLQPVSYERMKNHSNLAIFFLSTINAMGLREIIDPRLDVDEGKNMESMRRVAGLAKECLSVEGEKRPSMKEVVQELLWATGGERPHAWLNNDAADNPEEMVGLIVGEEERSEEIRAVYSIPQHFSSSFGIEGLGVGVGVRSGR
ncbi:hypothetical protein SUGI_0063520 [Cryptomeria japonica]|uniref:wall-associated receptor kinase-like 8 n=1 Tax=Cryptomeria japonica TaxID=3369 RepID=UPI002408D77E|nr:wall-associated receptor kinase-like 8 [Cryptomeria japonica]GLJ07285.1 hypothetical protein SUGI_0063520 [Cryptomeria japonica]